MCGGRRWVWGWKEGNHPLVSYINKLNSMWFLNLGQGLDFLRYCQDFQVPADVRALPGRWGMQV